MTDHKAALEWAEIQIDCGDNPERNFAACYLELSEQLEGQRLRILSDSQTIVSMREQLEAAHKALDVMADTAANNFRVAVDAQERAEAAKTPHTLPGPDRSRPFRSR